MNLLIIIIYIVLRSKLLYVKYSFCYYYNNCNPIIFNRKATEQSIIILINILEKKDRQTYFIEINFIIYKINLLFIESIHIII